MLLLLPLLLVPSVVVADQMPAEWLGKYQLETSEGFSAFMTEIGVNWFTRQVIFFCLDSLFKLFLKTDCLCPLPDSNK